MTITNTMINAPSLEVRRTYNVPRERVFAAWAEPERLRRWLAPPDATISELAADVREGGTYRIAMRMSDGELWAVRGTYREVLKPERLVFTWSWEEDKPEDEVVTIVTIELYDRGGATELVLTHAGFVEKESRDRHEGGWKMLLDQLALHA